MNIHKIILALFLLNSATTHAADEIHWTIMGQTSVTFDWRGSAAEDVVRYGTTPGVYTETVTAATPIPLPFSSAGPFWEAKITGLKENTRYYYSIAKGPEATFKTPPPIGDSGFTIFAQGDIGDTGTYFRVGPVQDIIADGQPDFVVGLGDLTYGNDLGQDVVDQHFNDVMVWSRDAAYMPIWGNHEWNKSTDDLRNYKGRFDLPNQQASPNSPLISCCGEDWYWFDYGNVRFIALPEPWKYAWVDWNTKATVLMEEAQADSNITFIVTFVHRPAYSSGHHKGLSLLKDILDNLGDNFTKYVLNVNGHSHNYERSYPQHGVVHVSAGASGSKLGVDGDCIWLVCEQPTWSAFRAMHIGALKLDFSANGIEGTYICGPAGGGTNDVECNQGEVIDTFIIGDIDSSPEVDAIAPSVPGDLVITGVSTERIGLSWTVSTDNVGVSRYKIYRDDVQIGSTTSSAFVAVRLSPATSYTFSVVAVDEEDNVSDKAIISKATNPIVLGGNSNVLTFIPTDDASIKQNLPTTNYGAKKLETDKSSLEHFLMKYDVSGIDGKFITGVKLRLYNINGSDKGGDFYLVADNSWSESTVNWNNAPKEAPTAVVSLAAVAAQQWYEVDVTSEVTADGIYSFKVISTSTNGADYNSKENALFSPQLIVTLDNTPPLQPTGLEAIAISTSQINLSWSTAKDDVSSYKIYRNNVLVGRTGSASFSVRRLRPLTSYTFSVAAVDKAGNISDKSVDVTTMTLTAQ